MRALMRSSSMTSHDGPMSRWDAQFEELLATRYSALVAYARLVSGTTGDAEDLVHDALLTTFGKARRFPNLYAAEGYVRRTIVSRFVDRARRADSRRRVAAKLAADPTFHLAIVPAAEAVVVDADIDAVLDSALASLTPRERAVVILRHVDLMSTRETADVLGLSEGAVKRYLSDALGKLHEHISLPNDAPTWVETSVIR